MQNFDFEDFDYLVILGSDGGDFDCYGCKSKDEVYKVVSDRILEEIAWLESEGDGYDFYTFPEEIQAYAEMIKSQGIIKNPAILTDCYDTFFADTWWFRVIDNSGEELFGHHY